MAKYGRKASQKVERAMRERKRGRLRSGPVRSLSLATTGERMRSAIATAAGLAMATIVAAGAAEGPTFSKDVAPVFYQNCTSCHRPGEIAPMSLLTYKDARPWARAIRERVTAGTMPPWHADPAHGEFANDRRL